MRRLAPTLLALALAVPLALPLALQGGGAALARPKPASHPVVVELFTAQGCAACPQANALLQELAGRKDVLALTLPVDIWDYLGWSDTFAKPEFTARQRAYIGRLKLREIYTPEMVVDGRRESLGFDREKVQAMIDGEDARRLAAPPVRFLSASRVRVGPGRADGGTADVWLVRYDPQERTVKVTAGENRGKTVVQQNVVRQLVRLGGYAGRERRFTLPPAGAEGLKTVVLLQGAKGGAIVASAARG